MSDKPAYRSVSQRNQYDRCPKSYALARIEKVWQKPAAWLPMGTAIHEAVEKYEKSGREMSRESAHNVARDSYIVEVGKYAADTPNLDYWQASGPYRGPEDLERRFAMLPAHVDRYIDWAETHDKEKVWLAPSDPEEGSDQPRVASELGFVVEFGDVPVRGFVDLVIVDSRGELVVRDVKTGNTPGDAFQLGVYARAVEKTFDLEDGSIEAGDYMMTKTGKPTFPSDLSVWSEQRVTDEFGELELSIKSGDFPAKPEASKCRFCDVAASCEFRAN